MDRHRVRRFLDGQVNSAYDFAMKRINLEVTDELFDTIMEAKGHAPMNRMIESWLWRIGDIKKVAKKLRLKRRKRRSPGRPKG